VNLLKLKKLANSRQFDTLESLWPDALDEDRLDWSALARIVGQVSRLGADQQADALLGEMLSEAERRAGVEERLAAARVAALEVPASALLRRELKQGLQRLHADYPDVSTLLNKLFHEDVSLDTALQQADRFLQLPPGAFLRDRGFLDPGMVESVDAAKTTLLVSFRGRHATFDRQQILQVIILPRDHFPSMLVYRPDELRSLADEAPVDFVLLALEATRDRTCAYRDLRLWLVQLLGEDGWNAWWKKARPVLKRSTRLEMRGASQPTFRVLRRQRSYTDRQRERFGKLADDLARLQFALSYLDEARREGEADLEFLAELGNLAARVAGAHLKDDPLLTLAALAVHAEVARTEAKVARLNPAAARKVLGILEDLSQIALRFSDRLQQSILHFVRDLDAEHWPEAWAVVLPRARRHVAELIAKKLLAAGRGDLLDRALGEILERPTSAPDVVCWLWRARHQDSRFGQGLRELRATDDGRILDALLELLEATGRMTSMSDDKRLRRVLEMAQEVLLSDQGAPLRRYLSGVDVDRARDLRDRMEENTGLRAAMRTMMTTALREAHPAVFLENLRPWEEQDVIYTTEWALQRRRDELDDLVKNQIPAVAKQIGEAAAHGDLSENSEYTAALEKRDQITSHATHIENELAQARLITPEMARSEWVNVGTRVRVRDLVSGREETFSFLGVWDSDPENHVLSYTAPLALAFMGHHVGDQVEYGEEGSRRRWEILAVEPALGAARQEG